ncbi:MAG: chorismate synthase [Clostridiales Family XIII bacterium]|jgi:chorismate synthase|nr:chorismate synthase [Clostridiales Family XIII bacterium]
MNSFGKNITLSIFGESHGAVVGITMDNIPAGISLDISKIKAELERRRPGKKFTSQREEKDEFEILSGINKEISNGQKLITNGYPLTMIIRNEDYNSKDYGNILRPSHADFPAIKKWGKFADLKGGGHFSGRLTAGIVFAGAVAKEILEKKYGKFKIKINSEILEIAGDDEKKNFAKIIETMIKENDSVGGTARVIAKNVPAGLGSPFFDSIESRLSAFYFSIPAVKGVSFGVGEVFAYLKGSDLNDEMRVKNNEVKFLSNNNGGILGGITTGEDIIVNLIVKPTASIAKKQKSIEYKNGKFINKDLEIKGRHDPCILFRALPVFESVMSIVLLDFIMGEA